MSNSRSPFCIYLGFSREKESNRGQKWRFFNKNEYFLKKVSEKFGGIKKKQYLCNRF